MEAAVGGEKDGRSDDPEVVGTSTHLCGWVAGDSSVAPESNVGLGGTNNIPLLCEEGNGR